MAIPIPTLSTSVLIFSTLLLGALLYSIHKFTTRISPNIPYAGEGSLIARLNAPLEYGKDPVEFLRKTRQRLGDVFCLNLFMFKIIFFLGSEGNKTVLRAAEDKLSFDDLIKWSTGAVLDSVWHVPGWSTISPKLLRFALLNQDQLHDYLERCAKVTEEHFEQWAAQGTVPLFKSFSHLVISYLLVILAGEDFYKRYGDELIPCMAQFERDLQHPILRITPNLLWKYTKPGKALGETSKRFEEVLDLELKDIMGNPEKHKDRRDYFHYVVSQVGDKYSFVYGKHIMSLVFAGHANVALTIPWLFLHARRTPGALERIREEAVLPADERKPFLEACLRETGRLYTNTSIMRMTKRRTNINGHAIPARTIVACSPLATQREDRRESPCGIYTAASHWVPERFLIDPSDYVNWFQRNEFVQFGWGAHACLGEKLARIFIFDLIFKIWMEKYEIDVASGLKEGVKGVDGVGAEAAWTEENFGTPSIRGDDVVISVKKRDSDSA